MVRRLPRWLKVVGGIVLLVVLYAVTVGEIMGHGSTLAAVQGFIYEYRRAHGQWPDDFDQVLALESAAGLQNVMRERGMECEIRGTNDSGGLIVDCRDRFFLLPKHDRIIVWPH